MRPESIETPSYYVEVPLWVQRWALRLGFTVMTHRIKETP